MLVARPSWLPVLPPLVPDRPGGAPDPTASAMPLARAEATTQAPWRRPRVAAETRADRRLAPLARALRSPGGPRSVRILAVAVAGLIVGWALVALVVDEARLEVAAPEAQSGAEAASAAIRLFSAMVLFLFAAEGVGRRRLRWVAGGFVVLGLGAAAFGYLLPSVVGAQDVDASLYSSLIVLTVADIFFVVGLLPASPPRFTRRTLLAGIAAFGVLSVAVVGMARWLPPLVRPGGPEGITNQPPWQALTAWHWSLFGIPLGLAIVAAVGAVVRHAPAEGIATWLVLAIVVYAGAQLHHYLWPTAYQPVLSSVNLLRLVAALIVAVGGLFELRRAAAERSALLAAEQEHARRLRELAVLKADFTAMVAHELASPIAAIRGFVDVLATGQLDPERQAHALTVIRTEVDLLNGLVADVRAIARDEREDFAVEPRSVPVDRLLADAARYAASLPGDHPLSVTAPAGTLVWADPDRIGQVLRNLLGNAAKYSPAAAPIEVRAVPEAGCVRIDVTDHGVGIHPDDLVRIFEKFGRGRDVHRHRVAGVGLGLYLSRRIIQMHGGDLTVSSTPGIGSTFSFELEDGR